MKIFFITACIIYSFSACAQDPHFSQYQASPLTLNPAMTGYFDGDFRINGNFRQQWWSVGSPYITGTISYDTKLMRAKLKNDVFGIGVLGLYDQSLNGGFKSSNISVSASYHKSLDRDNKNKVGIGFQMTYASRAINSEHLSFASQFNGSGFNTNLPSNENFGSLHQSYFDINAGLMYMYEDDKTQFYVGASLYHIGTPNISFLKTDVYPLPQRYTIHAGSKFILDDNNNELFIGGLFMQQASATDKMLGAAYGFSANATTMVYAGLWYRFEDAYVPYVGLSSGNFQLGLSYDVLNSGLKSYSSKNGSFELSLGILGSKAGNVYTNYKKGRF